MLNEHKRRIEQSWNWKPVPTMTLPEWSDTYRRLSSMNSAVSGQWSTARNEIGRGPMHATTEPGVRTITCAVGTQLFKTELLLGVIGFHMHQSPAPMLLVTPKDESTKSFARERLAPMLRATPALRSLIDERTRRTHDTLDFKSFPGGFLALAAAGSPMNLAMRAVKIVLCDEIDKYELSKEGDPLALAEERTATFTDALHVRCCSPTWEETSRIWKSYLQSDMRKPFVSCRHCGEWQQLHFFKAKSGAFVDWSKGDDGEHFPATACIVCGCCGVTWTEAERLRIMTTKHSIRWQQTRPFTCCGVEQEPSKWTWDAANQVGYAICEKCGNRTVSNEHAGFNCSKLYSPFVTVTDLAAKWILAKDDIESRQPFINTQLGLPFTARAGRKVEEHQLSSRREAFGDKLDARIVRLSAGVDAQENRLEVHIVGWAPKDECWSVYYDILPFTSPTQPDLWRRLDELLLSSFPHALGLPMKISAACIDSGHHTEAIYNFCRPRAHRNVWAVKGSSWSLRGDPVWPVPKSRITRESGFKPKIIAVDSAKDHLREMLLVEEAGPGYVHLPVERTDEWLAQLTAEQPVFERKGGVTTRRWTLKKGRANEAFDTFVYAYAALCGLKATRGLDVESAAIDLPLIAEKLKGEAA